MKNLKRRVRSFLSDLIRVTDKRYIRESGNNISGVSAVVSQSEGGIPDTPEPVTDELVKVTVNDTTADYLDGKITEGQMIVTTVQNGGGDESLLISFNHPNQDGGSIPIAQSTSVWDVLDIGNDGDILQIESGGLPHWQDKDALGIRHDSTTAKLNDDHTQYALLAGRAGGQIINGSPDATEFLQLIGTSNATKGKVWIGGSPVDRTDALAYFDDGNPLAVVINPDSQAHDFNVKGDTDGELIYADGSADRVGIGIAAPAYKLDVNGDVNVAAGSNFLIDGTPIGGGTAALTATYIGYGDGSNELTGAASLIYDVANYKLTMTDGTNPDIILSAKTSTETVFNENSLDTDFRVEGNGDANLLLCDAALDAIGVGIATPAGKLDVYQTADVLACRVRSNYTGGANTYPVMRIHNDYNASGQPVLDIQQDDADKAFLKFSGSVGSGSGYNIRSDNGSGSVVGPKGTTWTFASRMIAVDIAGSMYYIALYTG